MAIEKKEPFRHLVPSVRVVLEATGQPGKWEPAALHGEHGVFLGRSRPHGYARVKFDSLDEVQLVHPESLTLE